MKRNTFFPSSVRRPVYAPTTGEWLCMCLGILAFCALILFLAGWAPEKPAETPDPQPVVSVTFLPPYCNGLRSTAAAACSHCMAENCNWATTEYGQQVCGDRHSCRAD